MAFIGVDLFFVLSGFLISTLLIEEWDQSDTISLKRFYLRRCLRLLPALTAMLAAVVLYACKMALRERGRSSSRHSPLLFYELGLGAGISTTVGPFAHTWSLSIEEQFYLLWPVALIWLLRRTSSRSSLLSWVLLGAFSSIVARFILVMMPSAPGYRIYFGTDTRADALLLGCAAGVTFSSGLLPQKDWRRALGKLAAWVAVVGLIFLSFYLQFGDEFDFCVVYFLIPFFGALILIEVIRGEGGALEWILSRSWLVYIGKISYGLYLWHHPIFLQVQAQNWPLGVELVVETVLTAVAVLGSYYLLERPLLKWKEKFR